MIRLRNLLFETTLNEYTDEEKQQMGIPPEAKSRGGKWYVGDEYVGYVDSGTKKFVNVSQQTQQEPATQDQPSDTSASSDVKAKTKQAFEKINSTVTDTIRDKMQSGEDAGVVADEVVESILDKIDVFNVDQVMTAFEMIGEPKSDSDREEYTQDPDWMRDEFTADLYDFVWKITDQVEVEMLRDKEYEKEEEREQERRDYYAAQDRKSSSSSSTSLPPYPSDTERLKINTVSPDDIDINAFVRRANGDPNVAANAAIHSLGLYKMSREELAATWENLTDDDSGWVDESLTDEELATKIEDYIDNAIYQDIERESKYYNLENPDEEEQEERESMYNESTSWDLYEWISNNKRNS